MPIIRYKKNPHWIDYKDLSWWELERIFFFTKQLRNQQFIKPNSLNQNGNKL